MLHREIAFSKNEHNSTSRILFLNLFIVRLFCKEKKQERKEKTQSSRKLYPQFFYSGLFFSSFFLLIHARNESENGLVCYLIRFRFVSLRLLDITFRLPTSCAFRNLSLSPLLLCEDSALRV